MNPGIKRGPALPIGSKSSVICGFHRLDPDPFERGGHGGRRGFQSDRTEGKPRADRGIFDFRISIVDWADRNAPEQLQLNRKIGEIEKQSSCVQFHSVHSVHSVVKLRVIVARPRLDPWLASCSNGSNAPSRSDFCAHIQRSFDPNPQVWNRSRAEVEPRQRVVSGGRVVLMAEPPGWRERFVAAPLDRLTP